MTSPLQKLSDAGVAVWLDDISRERLRSGGLAALIAERNVVGVTSNPTIFAKALSEGDAYDAQLHDLAIRRVSVDEAVRAITAYDIRWGADVLLPVYRDGGGVDGRVSLEVDPRLARDTERTIAEARALWWLVDRPNLMIKIPATVEGLPAITAALAEGISVNVTLIFSLDRYRAVMEAFVSGLEQAKANGHDLSEIHSVASFFVSRVDSEVDKRLNAIGTEQALGLRSKAALANARLAYAAYEEVFAGRRWEALVADGAQAQRPLWASTGVKDPALPDTLYVTELVAPNTVNTMPEATLQATADHGEISGDTVRGTYAAARADLDALAAAGVDLDDVVKVLEDEGVVKFEKSWEELLERVAQELDKQR
ncbi:transaldolase [Nocardiopsis ansamitocini]|uniref:Transaldolase n=1 Tax=Nocardiopsis ansamitocini TaxID=1670832 RepID=A0A9W6UKV3_9ACTN|nr:transaldolase [Nocardiopsis ansamitocini]GLU49445.1 transaldolase 1 [Nocardiopsis ansamitocini]